MKYSSEYQDPQEDPAERNLPPSEKEKATNGDAPWTSALKQAWTEIDALRALERKRKREIDKLKLAGYAGLGGLALLFVFYSALFQGKQIQNLKTNQLQMREEMEKTRKTLSGEIQRLDDTVQGKALEEMQERIIARDSQLKETIGRIKDAISIIDPSDPSASALIGKFDKETDELIKAHAQYKQEELEKLAKKAAAHNYKLSRGPEIRFKAQEEKQ